MARFIISTLSRIWATKYQSESLKLVALTTKNNNMSNSNKTTTATKQLIKNYKSYGTQKGAILATLTHGTEFSVAEARAAGIVNPTAVVSQLREEGYEIYSNPHSRRGARRIAKGTVNRYRRNA